MWGRTMLKVRPPGGTSCCRELTGPFGLFTPHTELAGFSPIKRTVAGTLGGAGRLLKLAKVLEMNTATTSTQTMESLVVLAGMTAFAEDCDRLLKRPLRPLDNGFEESDS